MNQAPSNAKYFIGLYWVAVWQGMIGVLAKWITWNPAATVCMRCAISAIGLALLCRLRGSRLTGGGRVRVLTMVGGLLLAVHWGTLFWAYTITDVGPVVICVFTFPIMISVIEPWFFGERPQFSAVGGAILMFVGIVLLQALAPAEKQGVGGSYFLGSMLALFSAACFGARNVLSRLLLKHGNAVVLMRWQTATATLVLLPGLWWVEPAQVTLDQLGLLLVLGLFFTALPHTVAVWAMHGLSATTVGIVGSQQVVAGILFAWLLLNEQLHAGVFAGAALVLAAVVWQSVAHWRPPEVAVVSDG